MKTYLVTYEDRFIFKSYTREVHASSEDEAAAEFWRVIKENPHWKWFRVTSVVSSDMQAVEVQDGQEDVT